jgi:hypothetical protein
MVMLYVEKLPSGIPGFSSAAAFDPTKFFLARTGAWW